MEVDLYVRIAGSFVIVAILLWLFSRASRGRLGARLRGSRNRITFDPLVVMERRQLTKSNAVAIVRAGRRHVLVGYGEQGVQLLAEGDDLVEDPADPRLDPDLDDDLYPETAQIPAFLDHPRTRPSRAATTSTARAGGPSPANYQSARTRLPTANRPDSPRMSLMDTLREKTVRRS